MTLPPFQHLVDLHWRDVSALAHALTGPDEADDVSQQAWMQAYQAYPALTSARSLRGWLLTITYRCAMDAHRARARRAVPTDPADPQVLRSATARPGPDEALPDDPLWAAVAALPPRTRRAVVLRYVGDLDHRTIAHLLHSTPTMSRRLVSDGLAALRKAHLDD